MPYILALDQGTTSSRAILFTHDGTIHGVAQKEFTQHFPKPGWVEHDLDEIWSSQISVAAEVMSRAGLSSSDVAAIGITNQRETTAVWDRKTGRPICRAIVWQDRRTAPLCERLRVEGREQMVRERTGLVIDAYFSGTKLAWILANVPGAREKAERGELAFGTIDSWLVWKLTGGKRHVTDPSNASRTMLYNIVEQRWDDELLAMLNIPASLLPEVRASSEVYGETAVDAFARPVPIAGIAGDQQAALFGQVCTQPGMMKITYGTGGFLLQNTGDKPRPSANNLITTVAWRIGDRTEYALEGSIFIAGAVVQWLRDGLGLIRTAAEIEPLARSVPDSGGVFFVPAFTGLGAPHWDPHARGTILGLTRGSTAGHLARAALESIAQQVADVVEAMEADSGLVCPELRADGGAAANDLLLQIQADILGIPMVRPAVLETTALGAAYLAGLAVGFWKDRQEIGQYWSVNGRFEPKLDPPHRDRLRAGWRRALERARGWAEEA